MNRNRIIILTIGLLIILTGIWTYPKINQFFKVDSCLDKGGGWNYETNKCEFESTEEQDRRIYTISEYNTDLENENIERPEKTLIKNPTVDTTNLFKIWTLDPNGPHADFRFNKTEFYVVDYDGDGAMPYILHQDSLTIFYNDFIQKGRIISVGMDTLKIHWTESEIPTTYTEWKN